MPVTGRRDGPAVAATTSVQRLEEVRARPSTRAARRRAVLGAGMPLEDVRGLQTDGAAPLHLDPDACLVHPVVLGQHTAGRVADLRAHDPLSPHELLLLG